MNVVVGRKVVGLHTWRRVNFNELTYIRKEPRNKLKIRRKDVIEIRAKRKKLSSLIMKGDINN